MDKTTSSNPSPTNPVQPSTRSPRASSAFSRLANIALSGSSSATGQTSSASASAAVPAAAPTSLRRGGALDALETIANADQGRTRHSSADAAASGSGPAPSERRRFGSTSGRSWQTRNSSGSRSRDRLDGSLERPSMRITGASDGTGGYIDSPANMSLRSGSGYWGTENLPPNASVSAYSSFAGGSAIPGPGDSHFFPAGASGFSFEGPASSSAWDASYRSSLAGSPSLFDDTRPAPGLRQSTNDSSPLNPQTHSSEGFGSRSRNASAVRLWDLPNSLALHNSGSSSAIRASSPVGGGRKAKEASRGLRTSVLGISRDKGLVGLAKPPKEAEQGRVAVAGKTALKILKVPHGGSRRTSSAPVTNAPTPSSSYRSSSIAARRSRARGSPAPGAIADGSARGENDSEDEKEEISEVLDVRQGSRLGPAYLFSDVRWGYGGEPQSLV